MLPAARGGILTYQWLRHGFWNQDRSSTVPPIVHEVLQSGRGRPLDDSIRTWMEHRFGYDLSRVRIHSAPRAAESARAVNARAYTVGWDVVFGSGQYAPSSRAGLRLLAHELAHVVQQTSRPVEDILGLGSISINHPGDRFERSADESADAVMMRRQPVSLALMDLPTGPFLQRDFNYRDLNPRFMYLEHRLASVWRELQGRGPSQLSDETGYPVSQWRRFFNSLFHEMYRGIGSFPEEVVRDAAWASAIYEWAAILPGELGVGGTDLISHGWHGAQLFGDSGAGASIGPFQGYASMVFAALQNYDTVRFLAGSPFAQNDPGLQRIPLAGFMYTRDHPNRPPALRDAMRELSRFDILSTPVVSLIGKIQLSLRCAQEVSNELGRRHLPDPVLRWVLLCAESTNDADSYAEEVVERFDAVPYGGGGADVIGVDGYLPPIVGGGANDVEEGWVSLEGIDEETEHRMRIVFINLEIVFREGFRKT